MTTPTKDLAYRLKGFVALGVLQIAMLQGVSSAVADENDITDLVEDTVLVDTNGTHLTVTGDGKIETGDSGGDGILAGTYIDSVDNLTITNNGEITVSTPTIVNGINLYSNNSAVTNNGTINAGWRGIRVRGENNAVTILD